MTDFVPFQYPGLVVRAVSDKGLGLFCTTDIAQGALIERCLTLHFSSDEATHVDRTKLYDYYFSLGWMDETRASQLTLGDKAKAGCLAMGLTPMANHATHPNADVRESFYGDRIVFELYAVQPIPAGIEITISYGNPWFEIK